MPVTVREVSVAVYVSVAAGLVVEVTVNAAHPPDAVFGLLSGPLVARADATPVVEVNTRLIESFAVVTVLPAASFTQIVIVELEAPLRGIGLGETVAPSAVGAPTPVNEIAADAGVTPAVADAVAVHDSATASLRVNFTVVPLEAVFPVAGLPEPPAGVVLTTVAPQLVVVLGRYMLRVTGVGPKTLLPAVSCT